MLASPTRAPATETTRYSTSSQLQRTMRAYKRWVHMWHTHQSHHRLEVAVTVPVLRYLAGQGVLPWAGQSP
jgi:hypothetical protein